MPAKDPEAKRRHQIEWRAKQAELGRSQKNIWMSEEEAAWVREALAKRRDGGAQTDLEDTIAAAQPEIARAPAPLPDAVRALYEDAGETCPDFDTEEGAETALQFLAKRGGQEAVASVDATAPAALAQAQTDLDKATQRNAGLSAAAAPPIAGAVQAIYDSLGRECPPLETPEGAEEARRFLIERIEADDDAQALMAAKQESAGLSQQAEGLRAALVLARAGKNKGGPWRRIVRIAAVILLCAAVGGGWWTHKTAKESWETARAAEAQRADNATAMSAVRAAENARLREKLSGAEAERDNAGSLAGQAQAETRLVRTNAKKLLAAFTHACEVVPREKRRKIALCAAALAQACAALPADVRPQVSFCRP